MEKIKSILKNREAMLLGLILLAIILMTSALPRFFSIENFSNILADSSILIIVALGQFLVILTGGIDLSVGSIIAFCGMLGALINMNYPELHPMWCLIAGSATGAGLGLFNGVLVAYGNIPAIIVTLGSLGIFRGFTFILSKGQWVTAHEMTEGFTALPHGNLLGIPNIILYAIITCIVIFYFINYTRTGRELYAIGGNKSAAVLVGIKEERLQVLIFTICGLVSGLAGVLWAARYAAAVNEMAVGFELMTVAACVLGGVSISGGSGLVSGVILGALFMGLLNNSLTMIKNMAFYQMFIQGMVVIVAMVFNELMARGTSKVVLNRRLK